MQNKVLTCVLVLGLAATAALTGCKPKPKTNQPGAGGNQVLPNLTESGIPSTGGRDALTLADLEKRGMFAPVYFDYDSAKVRPNEMSKLVAVAEAMKGNSKKLVVEGHCDERGTAEYNRALGERRAQSARAELARLGVDASRISTISYGKDRPVEMAHEDTAWSRNRRCEFVLLDK